jgi:hypothetical protein
MPEMSNWAIEQGDAIQRGLTAWIDRVQPSQVHDLAYKHAFEAFDSALIETIKYMRARREGRGSSRRKEGELGELWRTAAVAVSPLDAYLADACMMKSVGWTDPALWTNAAKLGVKIGIADMQEARMKLNQKRGRPMLPDSADARERLPGWFPIAGVCFAVLTILILLYLLVGPGFEAGRTNIFNALIAFCVACSAAFLGGSAVARGKIPFFQDSPVSFSVYGGIGVFLVVYLVLHHAR